MQRQTCCALVDWFAGLTSAPGFSVNELLANAPASTRDPLDAAPPEPVALVADPYRIDKAGDFTVHPSALPAIYVHPDGPVPKEGQPSSVDRQSLSVKVAVRVILDNPNRAASVRYSDYVQRAIEQSLTAFLETLEGDAARQREGVWIVSANAVMQGPWYEAVGDARAVAATGIDFQVRDKRPRG